MSKPCQDSYSTEYRDLPSMLTCHEDLRKNSRWERTEVNSLKVAPLDKASPLYDDSDFDPVVSNDAVNGTANDLALAIKVVDHFFPLWDTAYKSLLDRAKIGGTALPKLSRGKLADALNARDGALLLVRDEKVSAAHSGDVNAITAVAKKLSLPKKSPMEASPTFEVAIGNNSASAHDVL